MVSVKRGKIKRGAPNKPSVKPKSLLKVGDWLDVLDGDGVWNVARVLSVPSPDKVEITYDGWPRDYDEVVSINSRRVAPYHTFTWTVKCWVKYLNWPLWPSVITIRTPGTTAGINNLAAENRLFVDFLDDPNFAKRDRCWQKKTHAKPFGDNYDRKRTGSTGESFERALGWVLQSESSSKMPKFAAGTLPIEYKLSPTKSVETVRRDMGDELWFQNFIHNRTRHQMNHVYETTGCEEDDRPCKDSMLPILNKGMLNLSDPRLVSSEKKRPAGIRVDQNPSIGKELPHEPEPMDSSDDFDIDDAQNARPPKRKRLHTKRRSDGPSNARKAEQEDLRRSVLPHMSKTSKSVAQLAAKNTKKNHSKGRTKMAARRRLQPIGELVSLNASVEVSADKSEVGTAQNVPTGAQLDTVPKHFAAVKRTKRSGRKDFNADSDHSLESEASIILSMQSKAMIECQNTDTKKKETALGLGQHLAPGKASRHERVRPDGHNLSSTRSQGTFQPISCVNEMEPHRLQLPYLYGEVDISSVQPKMNIARKGKTMTTTKSISKHSKELGCSLISATKIVSSDSDQLKGTSARKKIAEKNGSIQGADSMDSGVGTCVGKLHSALLDADKHSTHDDGCSQELRRRFCVMQADQEDADTTETVKCSKKTVISVPRKFKEISAPQIPTCCTDSMIGVAPPPRLRTSASCVQNGAALAAPSTRVFSSSNGFSMESWFKRKLMTDFMVGGT